jgi:hypothetical protein
MGRLGRDLESRHEAEAIGLETVDKSLHGRSGLAARGRVLPYRGHTCQVEPSKLNLEL